MNELLNWQTLGTYAGAVAFVTLVVQYFKLPLDKVWKIPTRILVYIISCLVLIVTNIATHSLSLETFILSLLNGFVIACASFGAYEVTFKKIENKEM